MDVTKEQRDYIWNYFSLHAGQRMALFNFFVAFSTVVAAGWATTFGKGGQAHWLGIALGLLLVGISFVFWRLDLRVRALVHCAEHALKIIERTWVENTARVFSQEEKTTEEQKNCRICRLVPITYYECFRLAFFMFMVFGVIGAIISSVAVVSGNVCQQ